ASANLRARAARQRRKRGAVDYTAAQTVAAALLASGMDNTVTAIGPRRRLRSSANSALSSKCWAVVCNEYVKPGACAGIIEGQAVRRFDSEQFRSTPRTCGCFRGILSLR